MNENWKEAVLPSNNTHVITAALNAEGACKEDANKKGSYHRLHTLRGRHGDACVCFIAPIPRENLE
jgi:hypothetical protein